MLKSIYVAIPKKLSIQYFFKYLLVSTCAGVIEIWYLVLTFVAMHCIINSLYGLQFAFSQRTNFYQILSSKEVLFKKKKILYTYTNILQVILQNWCSNFLSFHYIHFIMASMFPNIDTIKNVFDSFDWKVERFNSRCPTIEGFQNFHVA